MSRHNKKRNTAFLYEALVREVVKRTINKNTDVRDKVIAIIKETFTAKSEIGKELRLFKTLLETKGVSSRIGEKLIQETKKEYQKLDEKKIFSEQSALIKKINKEISKSVFSNFVPNYKDIATISQIFGEDVNIKHRVLLEERILSKIANRTKAMAKNDKINNLVVSKFIGRFNSQYGATLTESQKTLLNKYILSFLDNGVDLKMYLNEEIYRLKEVVKKSYGLEELKNDSIMKEKMGKLAALLESFSTKPIDKDMLQSILKVQLVVKEVQS